MIQHEDLEPLCSAIRCHCCAVSKHCGSILGAHLQAGDSLLHVSCSVLAEVDQADVAKLVAVMVHGCGVDWAQLKLLPLQLHLHTHDANQFCIRQEITAAIKHTLLPMQILSDRQLRTKPLSAPPGLMVSCTCDGECTLEE